MNRNKKVSKRKVAAGVAAVAVAAAIGIGGASAFFTDQASISKKQNVGTMNMKLTDLSDLDGQHGTFDSATGKTTGAVATEGYQGTDYTVLAATDAANPSTGIINPGDDGIYAYKIENTAEKSFDTAKVTKVTVKIKGTDPAGNAATITKADDAGAYTISGLGTPYVKQVDDQTLELTYASNDTEVLSGSVEKDGKGTSAAYAYNTVFARDQLKNKFQDADVKIDTTVYAKQHRNGMDSKLSVNAETGALEGTGDWAEVGSFETVLDN